MTGVAFRPVKNVQIGCVRQLERDEAFSQPKPTIWGATPGLKPVITRPK
jgi:hypothetical protein